MTTKYRLFGALIFGFLFWLQPAHANSIKCANPDITWAEMQYFEITQTKLALEVKGFDGLLVGRVEQIARKEGNRTIREIKVGGETIPIQDIHSWQTLDEGEWPVEKPVVEAPTNHSKPPTVKVRPPITRRTSISSISSGSPDPNAATRRLGPKSPTAQPIANRAEISKKAEAEANLQNFRNRELERIFVDREKLAQRNVDIIAKTQKLKRENLGLEAQPRKINDRTAELDGFTHTISNNKGENITVNVASVSYEMPVGPTWLFDSLTQIKTKLQNSDFLVNKTEDYIKEGYLPEEAAKKAKHDFARELAKRADKFYYDQIKNHKILGSKIGSYKTSGGNALIVETAADPDVIAAIPRPFKVDEDTFEIEMQTLEEIVKELQFGMFRDEALKGIHKVARDRAKAANVPGPRWRIVENITENTEDFNRYGIAVRPYKQEKVASRVIESMIEKRRINPGDTSISLAESLVQEYGKDIDLFEVDIIALGDVRFGFSSVNQIGDFNFKVGTDVNFGNNMTEDGWVFDK